MVKKHCVLFFLFFVCIIIEAKDIFKLFQRALVNFLKSLEVLKKVLLLVG